MGSVIVGGARTPIGKNLGGYAIAAALDRSTLPRHIDYGDALIIIVPSDGS